MTAKADGLWDPVPPLPGLMPVTSEDISHMKSRVTQFEVLVPVPGGRLAKVPECKKIFCRWLVADATELANGNPEHGLELPRLKSRAVPALLASIAGDACEDDNGEEDGMMG